MQTSRLLQTIFALLLLVPNGLLAQGNMSAASWKKTVTRQVEIEPFKEGDPKSATAKNREVTLLEVLIKEIKAGRLAAYSNIDHEFSNRILPNDNNNTINGKRDTVQVTDPVTGANSQRVYVTEPTINIHTYRTLEEWTCNPVTGTTDIQITGIAPIREVYGDDGIFRGIQAIFWIKFADAISIIQAYEKEHKKNVLTTLIWNDNFANPEAIGKNTARTMRIVDAEPKEDTVKHHLRDQTDDSTLAELAVEEVLNRRMPAYTANDNELKNMLPALNLAYLTKLDTITVTDPISGGQVQMVKNTVMMPEERWKFGVIEDWTTDMAKGKTHVQIRAIALLDDITDATGAATGMKQKMLFKYLDTGRLRTKLNSRYPTRTIEGTIWNNYFLSDVRPEVVK